MRRSHPSHRSAEGRSRNRSGAWIFGLLALAGVAFLLIPDRPRPASATAATTNAAAAGSTTSPPAQLVAEAGLSPDKLGGRWVRPDGGYVLEVRRIDPGGAVQAGYFNPNPIHVARAEWSRVDGRLGLFVELRDVNYPGATYKLTFDPAREQLTGEYFQPAIGQTFHVAFERQ